MENTDSTNIVAQQPKPVNDYELARQVGIFYSHGVYIPKILFNSIYWDAEADSRE